MTQGNLTLEAGPWSSAADAWIAQAITHASVADIRAQVESGAQLCYAKVDGMTVGACVLRIDCLAEWNEGVIVAAAASLCGVDLIDSLLPLIEGKFKGCRRLRFHTSNTALLRRMAMFGYGVQEVVGCKELQPPPVLQGERDAAAVV